LKHQNPDDRVKILGRPSEPGVEKWAEFTDRQFWQNVFLFIKVITNKLPNRSNGNLRKKIFMRYLAN
jgi:hypothetical protein